jgi:hypothetical protein
MSLLTARARFDGSVHGVVVQTRMSSPVSSRNITVTTRSWRSR